MTEILICGANGTMGKILLDALASEPDMRATCGVDIRDEPSTIPVYKRFSKVAETVDIIVDFSSASNVEERLLFAKQRNIGIVIGATGLSERDTALIDEYAREIPIFVSSNFSPAVWTLNELVKEAAHRLGGFDASVIEIHHKDKKDAPSGTAKTIMQTLECIQNKPVSVLSVRGGDVAGYHEIGFYGDGETLTLSHRAENKKVFALGAIRAAKFLLNKRKGKYGMDDLYQKTLSE